MGYSIEDAFAEIDKYSKLEGLTEKQIFDSKRVYELLSAENSFGKLSDDLKESTATSIVNKVKRGASVSNAFSLLGENKHILYYDFALSKGESENILDALSKYGVGASSLLAIRANVDFDEFVAPDVFVHQKIESVNGESPSVTEFTIDVGGKVIYDFNKEYIPRSVQKDNFRAVEVVLPNGVRYSISKNKAGRIIKRDSKTGRFMKQ